MPKLTIIEHPDERLRVKARTVDPSEINDGLNLFVSDMLETMYAARGIGLAATQVGDNRRIAVIDTLGIGSTAMVLVNPEITKRGGLQTVREGCLSVRDRTDYVTRSKRITVRAMDANGNSLRFKADGLLAACIQHEIDHLDGILFLDHVES